ncbi:MAG: AraC family transcriptional regulator [Ramlibacter sp.]|jgi:AraC-like DNA-binding protein|uniref:AraC family transcriptional regulator n=1 Tax=Ramlibacter sp. TaxID=1917967 RepID=UPI0026065FA8|nr:AraC family transcriptional regulator [Ramlibacter sp.]MDB5751692.1 AraC family transcriptional regulator [Ramlibacter sp.]
MDALSEVLRVVRLNSAVFFNARFSAPWCFSSPQASTVMHTMHPGTERLVIFHLLTEGQCRMEVEGAPTAMLQAGDVIVFPHGDAHTMSSAPDVAPAPPADLLALLRRGPREVRFGGGGAISRFVCGYLSCDPRLCRPILTALPRVLTVNLRGQDDPGWLELSIRYAVAEAAAARPGGAGVLAKLSEVLFVETLRRYMAQLGPEQTGWLAGVRDRVVGKALALMHGQPAHPWTVDSLARECGISRSVLAERFTHFVGQSPMHYLGRWRMALAAGMLKTSSSSITRVAKDVGYETDPAFTRAFRREFGMPPAAWRTGATRNQGQLHS